MNKKIFLFLLLNIIILSGLAVGYLWYIGNNGQPSDIGQTTTQDNVKEITSDIDLSTGALAEVDTSDWQTYRNEEYGFEFMYPEGWEIGQETKRGVKLFINNSKKDTNLYRIADISINKTEQSVDFEIDKAKNGLVESWFNELGYTVDIPENLIKSKSNNEKDFIVLGPVSPPSGMYIEYYLIGAGEKTLVIHPLIFGGDEQLILNDLLSLANTVNQ